MLRLASDGALHSHDFWIIMAVRHFLDLDALDRATLMNLMTKAHLMKAAFKQAAYRDGGVGAPAAYSRLAEGSVLAMLFDKPSTRTRVSFDVAMRQLGGDTIVLNSSDMQLGRGETIADTARVLSRYINLIMLRSKNHEELLELAEYSDVPVINGLTDRSHPCQVFADIMTFEEKKGSAAGRSFAWVGDGNNVAASWIHAAVRFGFSLRIACPEPLRPPVELLDWARNEGADVALTETVYEAVSGTDCVVTDVWVSMGDNDAERRMELLRDYQVNASVMACAGPEAVFMHCLPAHRGWEVTTDVIDGPQSLVFDEAENRLHAQRAILAWCLEKV
jgi:ornithine carbamoyltransferase